MSPYYVGMRRRRCDDSSRSKTLSHVSKGKGASIESLVDSPVTSMRRKTQNCIPLLPVFLHSQHCILARRGPPRQPGGDGAGRHHRSAQARPRRAHGICKSIVQWKLCGLTTCTSTVDTARPRPSPASASYHRPRRAFSRHHRQNLPARQAQVREQPELFTARQHLRAEARRHTEKTDRNRHALQPVGHGKAAVKNTQRGGANLVTEASSTSPCAPATLPLGSRSRTDAAPAPRWPCR